MSGTRSSRSGRRGWGGALVGLAAALPLGAPLGCREAPAPTARASAVPADAAPPWAEAPQQPTPPRGMAFIPDGSLVAGTPPGRVPRLADTEMPGEQIMLRGFFMDVFPYPNEEGAIPETGVSHARAETLCRERGKRLCTELEWERACKGPRNLTYEYGDRYRPEVCATGRAPRMLPSGYHTACRSEFGVRDLHGGVWEWTMSRWGRGNRAELFSVRGGNSPAGELVGRCANAMGRAPATVSPEIGFRCCKGEVNEAQVSLRIESGTAFAAQGSIEPSVAEELQRLLPEEVRQQLAGYGRVRITGVWDWRPIGNVPLVVGAACAGEPPSRHCGVAVAAFSPGPSQLLTWVGVGLFPPTPKVSRWDRRRLWVHGGDRKSFFRQELLYEWGRVRAGELVRKLPKQAG